MKRVAEVIVVEGKYDKNTLSQTVDASIVTLDGFAAFHDREKLSFLRRLAEKRGLIILTDSDGAGFVLRGFLKGALPPERVKHAYIPDIPGRERRKRAPSKEGKLGVEGMSPAVLLDALRRAGATFLEESPETAPDKSANSERPQTARPLDESANVHSSERPQTARPLDESANVHSSERPQTARPITAADLYTLGLNGSPHSADRRRELLRRLSLPEKLNARGLLDALNLLYSREQLYEMLQANPNA